MFLSAIQKAGVSGYGLGSTSPEVSFFFLNSLQFSSVQSLRHVWLFETPWTAAHQASLSISNPWSLLKLMSFESVMPSNHPTVCYLLFLLTSIFPSIRVFSNESVLPIRWPKYWSFSTSPSNEYSGLISFRMDWFDLLAVLASYLRVYELPGAGGLPCSISSSQ